MKFGLISVILAAMTLLQGCSDTIDGTSVAAYKKSVEKMSEKMMPTQQRQLAQDMLLASESVQKMNVGTKVFASLNEEYLIEAMAKDLNGKSVADIQKMAEKRRAEIKKAEIKAVEDEISKTKERLAKETALLDELQRIRFGDVTVSEIAIPIFSAYYRRIEDVKHWNYQVLVKNDSSFTVQRIKFNNRTTNHATRFIPVTFDPPLKPNEEKVINVHASINENIRQENLIVPPLNTKDLEFEMTPEGSPGQYQLDRSSSIDHLNRMLTEKQRQLEKLRSGS